MKKDQQAHRVLSEGTISAEEQREAIGAHGRAREGTVPLSPNQRRQLEADEWPAEGETPDYEVTIISGEDAFDVGDLPDRPLPADGTPVPLPMKTPPRHARERARDTGAAPPPSDDVPAADTPGAKELLSESVRHGRKVLAAAREANASGDRERQRIAGEQVKKTHAVAERVNAKLGIGGATP